MYLLRRMGEVEITAVVEKQRPKVSTMGAVMVRRALLMVRTKSRSGDRRAFSNDLPMPPIAIIAISFLQGWGGGERAAMELL
eukprot:scaffold19359_cov50-Cyclotella_meneghiniana.AAC.1